MTKPYFRQVPNFDYVSRLPGDKYISEYIQVKNLFKRGKLREDIFGNLAFFKKYSIIGDERPDNVAYKFYGDSTLDWVVLLSNNILNIQSEWPMTQVTFDKVMLKKYGSYENLYSGIHHYETKELKNSLGQTILKEGLTISDQWKTNGNFIEVLNAKIQDLYAGDGENATTTITVNPQIGIPYLQVDDEITIENIPEKEYNGTFKVTEIDVVSEEKIVYRFRYELPEPPKIAFPTLANPRKEQVLFKISEFLPTSGNSYYYEYWDPGLGYTVSKSFESFINPITNYEHELRIEDSKRNIFILKPRYLNVIFNDMDDIMPYKKGGDQYVDPTLKKGDNIRLYE